MLLQTAAMSALAMGVNGIYAAIALAAARKYGIALCMHKGFACAILLIGTVVECAALAADQSGAARSMLIVAFGAIVVAAACDAACGYVFDAITLPSLTVILALSVAHHALWTFAAGVAACGGSLLVLHWLSRARGLGLGDVKLACCIGGAAGVLRGVEAIGIAFVLGGAYAAFLLLNKRARLGTEVRFAPYLAVGTAIVLVRGFWA